MQFLDEDAPFVSILKAMGIDEYDPLVPIAINEYAAKFALELLKDAKDYSNHAKRGVHTEIESDDVKLAVKLSDIRVTGLDQRESVIISIRDKVNKKSLTELADPNSVINRYPTNMFCQRTHTYIPGSEAYIIDEEEFKEKSAMDIEQHQDQQDIINNSSLIINQNEQSNAIKFQTIVRTVSKKLEAVPGFSD